MNYNKNNSCFICHKCLHTFFLKTDLERHVSKKEVCESKYNCLLSMEDIKSKSVNKRYYFYNNINPNSLETYQRINLVNNYHEKLNIIQNISEISKSNKNPIINKDTNININDYVFMIDQKKHYKCLECKTIYKKRESMINHIYNKDLCNKNKLINSITNPSEFMNNVVQTSQETNLQNFIYQNQSNTQIVNNIQNNHVQNNNNSQNSYSVKINDFIENNYTYSHIPLNKIQNKDFYLYKNFLHMILENDENKNIYFDGKYAFIYSDGGLKRIQSDKAGCLLLEKLNKAICLYICSNPQSFTENFEYVDKYYSIIRNKYVFDTIYKPYNIETKKYDYCETNNIRTRDKCLSDITQVCNMYKERTKQIMKEKEYDEHEIDTNYQVNIPFYESSKMRNKAFLDNGKYY